MLDDGLDVVFGVVARAGEHRTCYQIGRGYDSKLGHCCVVTSGVLCSVCRCASVTKQQNFGLVQVANRHTTRCTNPDFFTAKERESAVVSRWCLVIAVARIASQLQSKP